MEEEIKSNSEWFHVERSEWSCYMFGNTPGGYGLVYTPEKGKVPNRFVRWMMKICFACTWVKGMSETSIKG